MRKISWCISGIIILLVIMRFIYGLAKKSEFIAAFTRAEYIEYVDLTDEKSLKKMEVRLSEQARNTVIQEIKSHLSLCFWGRKSVACGCLKLFDKDKKIIINIDIFIWPLYSFDGAQVELQCDLANIIMKGSVNENQH